MSKLQDIKRKVNRFANRNVDQEDARIERARKEARAEAKRERTKTRVKEAREAERERVLNDGASSGLVSQVADTIESASAAVDDGDDERLDDLSRAFGSDFDGDGETLAEEFGLQSAARADREDREFTRLDDRIEELDRGMREQPGAGQPRDAGEMFGGGGFEPLDPEEFGFSDDGGLFGGERR